MVAPRALRVLLVANDGFSAGHVVRSVAIARALARCARTRGIGVQLLLATTSEADAVLASDTFAVVRLPAPVAARRAGFGDVERRRIVRAVLEGTFGAFAPDLLVCDTFPSGPHGELAGLGSGRCKRALVRRAVPDERADEEATSAGFRDHELAIVADDPGPHPVRSPIPVVRVPPITIGEAFEARTREEARRALGLPLDCSAVLVGSGGGGDHLAVERARELARVATRVDPEIIAVRTRGPLERAPLGTGIARAGDVDSRIFEPSVAPMQPLLAAFDGAFAPAGYNTAHELAKAGVPAALFAQPRPFDDQAARARRFAERGFGFLLERFDDDAVAAALAWMKRAPRPPLEAGGADAAAEVLLDLATGKPIGRGPDARTEEASR